MNRSPTLYVLLAGLAMLLALPSAVFANEPAHDDKHPEAHSEEHAFHRNVIGVFAGVTSESRREEAFTLGIEYERRLSERFGVGGLVERAMGDLEFWVYAVTFAYHEGPWKFYGGPGIEDSDAHGNEFLFRVGVEYAWEVGSYEIAPQLDVDFVDGEHELVLGLVLARGF